MSSFAAVINRGERSAGDDGGEFGIAADGVAHRAYLVFCGMGDLPAGLLVDIALDREGDVEGLDPRYTLGRLLARDVGLESVMRSRTPSWLAAMRALRTRQADSDE
jgi:hypothetical protein